MQRKINKIRYTTMDIEGHRVVHRSHEKVVEDVTTLPTLLTEIRPLKRNQQTLLQFGVRTETGKEYWLDENWFLDQLFVNGNNPQDTLNRFNEVEELPAQITRVIRDAYMVDAIQFGFRVNPVRMEYHPNADIPIEDKMDYRMTKEGVDYEKLGESTIVTMGGFAHRCFGVKNDAFYIYDGFKTARQQQEIDIGLISFENIGKIKTVEITRDNYRPEAVENLHHLNGAYLNFPDVDLSKYQLAISIGGYLHFMDGHDPLIHRVSEHMIKLDMRTFSWSKRIPRMMKALNIGKLGMTKYEDGRLAPPEMASLETFLNVLDLSQTFLVLIEADSLLMFSQSPLARMNYPRRYFTRDNRYFPFRLGDGRFPAYMFKREHKYFYTEYVLSTVENLKVDTFDELSETDNEPFRTNYARTTRWPTIQKGNMYRIQAIKTNSTLNNYEGVIRE